MQGVALALSPAPHKEPSFAGGEEKSYFAPMTRRRRAANPAEVLICGNAGVRKDLGALSRSSGLPQRPASSRFSSRWFPGEIVKSSMQ